jgi:hypothetical protein
MNDKIAGAIGSLEADFGSSLKKIEAIPGGVTHALEAAKTKLLE